ncbi:hypothetical protein PY310_14865 [Pseudarthrobacter sp. H3Y2-7]|uniref:hypothetical protein n=1 Tax=Pseudarthrobacter naphthalenicus TaxID=3031328 RepID=UPI0023B00F08|nr:hypothetical protein [Pseudarthrobacter sp. H3Y2-7]MDE8669862.1 hypothetical protein [Pseudarthrobacter sp. H3Y2-7]
MTLIAEVAAPAAFDDGVPAPFSGAATAGLAMAAMRAAAAAAVRTWRMGGFLLGFH